MNQKKEIVKIINSMSGSRSPYDVFCDWVKCMALAFANQPTIFENETWRKREAEYLKTIQQYGEDGIKFVQMKDLLIETMDNEFSDVLGEIYMESGCGNKNTGQFFTPFHVSLATAGMSLAGADLTKPIYLNEPSCGGGGMIIAVAKVLQEKGIDFQRSMKVLAQDLDWKAVYMCYVQLSLLGIDAIVVQGNTLTEPDWKTRPPECIFRTFRNRGVFAVNETTDERETLVNEICNYLIPKVSDISDTKNALYIIMSNYEITNRCTEIVELQGNRNEEILKRFLIAKSVKGCTERTIYYYKTSIQYALAQINKNIDNITSDDIRLYIALRMRRDKVTDVTAANELRNLRSFFNWIYGEEIIKKNPITKVDRIKQHKTQKEALTEMEIEKLRMAVRNEREQMIIEFLLSTGCRVSEFVQIKLEEIEGARVLVHGKGQKDRRVYLNAKAQLSLERYLACRNDENPYLLPAGFGAMLPAEKRRGRRRNNMADWWRYPEMVVKDKPLDKGAIDQTLRKIAKRAGVERANPHKFRRTCATLALRRGMPIEQVSKMLGHEQISTTQIYLDLSEEDLIQAHKKYVL